MKLLLVQGIWRWLKFIQSAWETTKNVPGVGALFGELAEENRVFIEKTKRDELALRKSIVERDARIRQGEMGYINRSRATGVSKGPGQQEAVSRLAEELTGKKHTSPKTRSAGEREEEQAREVCLPLKLSSGRWKNTAVRMRKSAGSAVIYGRRKVSMRS